MSNDIPQEETSPLFTNDLVQTRTITTENLLLSALSPRYRKINMITSAVFGVIVLAILALATSELFFDLPENADFFVKIGYSVVTFVTLWSVVYHFFADPLKMYALREHDLNYQSGLIFKSLVSQPILRIQHIEISRGPIERRAGLATLQVFSAGGIAHTFNIPGLVHEDAVSLRQFILDHKDLASDV